jgi:hypothetical protein
MKLCDGIERRQFILSSLAAVVGGRMFGEMGPITLAQGGKSGYSICVARDCSPSERRGAEELQRFNGEWRLIMPGIGLELSNRFPNDQVDRCQLTWRSRGEDRIYLSLLSGVRTLAAGESLRLDADYAVSPGTKRL